jgi:hypothetical protein
MHRIYILNKSGSDPTIHYVRIWILAFAECEPKPRSRGLFHHHYVRTKNTSQSKNKCKGLRKRLPGSEKAFGPPKKVNSILLTTKAFLSNMYCFVATWASLYSSPPSQINADPNPKHSPQKKIKIYLTLGVGIVG